MSGLAWVGPGPIRDAGTLRPETPNACKMSLVSLCGKVLPSDADNIVNICLTSSRFVIGVFPVLRIHMFKTFLCSNILSILP